MYKILTSETPRELSEFVSELMEYGWVPQGGVSVASNMYRTTFSQAMVQPIAQSKSVMRAA